MLNLAVAGAYAGFTIGTAVPLHGIKFVPNMLAFFRGGAAHAPLVLAVLIAAQAAGGLWVSVQMVHSAIPLSGVTMDGEPLFKGL